jgi:hypothetical protein
MVAGYLGGSGLGPAGPRRGGGSRGGEVTGEATECDGGGESGAS